MIAHPLLAGAGRHGLRGGGAPPGKARHQRPRRPDRIVGGAGVLLGAAPAALGEIENNAVRIAEFDFVKAAALLFGLAHQPLPARRFDAPARLRNVVDPHPEMVQPDMIAPQTLRRLVRFEMQQGDVDDAVRQKHPLGQARIGLADDFEAIGMFVEFGRPPRVGHRQRDVTQFSHESLPGMRRPANCNTLRRCCQSASRRHPGGLPASPHGCAARVAVPPCRRPPSGLKSSAVFDHRAPIMLFGLLAALVVALAAGPAAASGCAGKPAGVERLVCSEPSLAALAADLDEAFAESRDRIARTVEQENWLRGRRAACPAIASPKPDPLPGSAQREVALACLERLYRQRIAVLRYPLNRAAWPHVPFLPRLVAGAGTRLCEDLEQDLVAGFLGRGAEVDPLGEREIGFAPQPGLGDDEAPVLRADIDVYNSGKPVPVLAWIGERNGTKTVEYRVFSSPGELLAAID